MHITEHKDYGQRCATAAKLLDDKHLSILTAIDGMDNKVNEAYKAYPDRVFLVRRDGKLAVAASRGPAGFEPALNATAHWLAELKRSGKEPEPGAGEPRADGR